MKAKAALIIFILVAIGLGVGLIAVNQRAEKDKLEANGKIATYSNQVVKLESSLADQQTVNLTLETNLANTKREFSNKLTVAEASLASTTETLTKVQSEAKAAAEAAAAEIEKRDKKIASLENQNQELDKTAVELKSSITNLESQIASTQQKLANSEGERDFLLAQLKRLQAEKADLEKKFNDLAVLREQVKKLKEELALSRRLEWLRRGIYGASGMKGGERMVRGQTQSAVIPAKATLEVELKQDGTVKVQSVTNAPAASTNNPPSK